MKGTVSWDVGYVYCPYIPLHFSDGTVRVNLEKETRQDYGNVIRDCSKHQIEVTWDGICDEFKARTINIYNRYR